MCEQARRLLRSFEKKGRLEIEVVDIGADRELLARYGVTIPVLETAGGSRLDWPFDRSDVERVLA